VTIGLKRQLGLAVGAARPRTLDRDAAAAERHLARLVSVPDGAALGVVLAPRADDLVELLGHQLGQHAEPDTHRQREQPLLRGPGQLAERLLHPHRQRRDLINQYLLHGGSSCLGWTSAPSTLPTGADGAGGPPPQLLRATGQPLSWRRSTHPESLATAFVARRSDRLLAQTPRSVSSPFAGLAEVQVNCGQAGRDESIFGRALLGGGAVERVRNAGIGVDHESAEVQPIIAR
jgi:hypothetical protein